MKCVFFALGIGLSSVLSGLGEEKNSAQRLENAQRGMAEGSWPRKPDNRLSPLSGKMQDSQEISVRYYRREKEFAGKWAEGWAREAPLGQKPSWEGEAGRRWEEDRWGQERDKAPDGSRNERYRPDGEVTPQSSIKFRELERESAGDRSSQSARLGRGREGSLRMYEGRLTRVRQQVWQESEAGRELGTGRQEKFSPQEVEKMLSQPAGRLREAAKEQSPAASPLAAADN